MGVHQKMLYVPAPITPLQASEYAFTQGVLLTPQECVAWASRHGHLLRNKISQEAHIDFEAFYHAVKFGSGKRKFKPSEKEEKKKALEEAQNDYTQKKDEKSRSGSTSGARKYPSPAEISLQRISTNWLNSLKSGLLRQRRRGLPTGDDG